MSESARRLVTSFRNLTKVGPQREPAGTEFREEKDRHVDIVIVKGTVHWPQRFNTEFGCAAFGRFGRKPDESWTTERTCRDRVYSEQKDRHVDSYCEGNSPLAAEIQY